MIEQNLEKNKIEYFCKKWDQYKNIMNDNFLYHKEIQKYFSSTIKNYIQTNKNPLTIADFGCGDCSKIIPNLSELSIEKYIGIDASNSVLNFAENNFSHFSCQKEFICDYMEKAVLKITDSSLDFIFSSYALHHLTTEKKIFFMEQCFKKLKPQGFFYLADAVIYEDMKIGDWQKFLEKKLTDNNFNSEEIHEFMQHVRTDDIHENLEFFFATAEKQKWPQFNILFKSDISAIMLFSKSNLSLSNNLSSNI